MDAYKTELTLAVCPQAEVGLICGRVFTENSYQYVEGPLEFELDPYVNRSVAFRLSLELLSYIDVN